MPTRNREKIVKIVLISDGKYGDRAVETIESKFPGASMVFVEPRNPAEIIDEYDFEPTVLKAIQGADLVISYIRHPDINLELATLDKPLIVAIDHGQGFLNQLRREHPNVSMPSSMCHLQPTSGIPAIDEFAQGFGLPRYEIELDPTGSRFASLKAIVESPCSATARSLPLLAGAPVTPETINAYAINVAQECRESVAYMMSKSDGTERATLNHVQPLLEALERVQPSLFESDGALSEYAGKIEEMARKYRQRA